MRLAEELTQEIFGCEDGCVVVVGVGNEHHGDDGVGPLIIRLLENSLPKAGEHLRIAVIDGGAAPELETWRIRELAPSAVLFVDAVDFGRNPGDIALLKIEDLRADGFDTHRTPLRLTMQYLECELGAKCRLLAVQPRDVRLGSVMCPEVRSAADSIASLIIEAFKISRKIKV